ncbi:MAG: endolytic transglycosylase MltG, partial [Bdellovibrionales bacterium]|nr:endolytic transglycosylase MltG [Bdellovibrionales bacterium]
MKGLAKLFVAGFATAALVILGYVYLSLMVPSGGTPENYVIEVPPGQPFYKIAYQMENDGAIRSARILVWYSTLTGKAAKVQVGEYEVGGEDSAISILGILMSGKSKSYPVTIQEGLNMYEIADIL